MKPRCSRLCRCLCTVASDESPKYSQISASVGAYSCSLIYFSRKSTSCFCRLVSVFISAMSFLDLPEGLLKHDGENQAKAQARHIGQGSIPVEWMSEAATRPGIFTYPALHYAE